VPKNFEDAKQFLQLEEAYPERQFIALNKKAELLEPHPEYLPHHQKILGLFSSVDLHHKPKARQFVSAQAGLLKNRVDTRVMQSTSQKLMRQFGAESGTLISVSSGGELRLDLNASDKEVHSWVSRAVFGSWTPELSHQTQTVYAREQLPLLLAFEDNEQLEALADKYFNQLLVAYPGKKRQELEQLLGQFRPFKYVLVSYLGLVYTSNDSQHLDSFVSGALRQTS